MLVLDLEVLRNQRRSHHAILFGMFLPHRTERVFPAHFPILVILVDKILCELIAVGKRLELLREAVRGFTRVGVVLDPNYAAADGTLKALPSAARELGLEARVYEVRSAAELEAAFAAAARDGMQALYVPEAPLFLTRRSEIAAAAASVRLPAIYTFREFVQAGGLMSYGADLPALYQRVASYIDKSLKGAKPGRAAAPVCRKV